MKDAAALMLAATMIGCAAGAVEPPVAARRLSIEQLIDIKHPSDPVWSPDGRFVAFTWDRAGISNLYVADAGASNGTPRQLTSYTGGAPAGAFPALPSISWTARPTTKFADGAMRRLWPR